MKTVDQSPRMHSHTIETTTKGQRFQLQDNRSGAVAQAKLIETIQRQAMAPVPTSDAAITAGPTDLPYSNPNAIGPTHLSSYTLTVRNPALNRNAAVGNIRTEYRSVGAGYQGREFLCPRSIRRYCEDPAQAAYVYDKLQAIVNPRAVLSTDDEKQKLIKKHTKLFDKPANLELYRNDANIAICDPVGVYVSAEYGAASPLKTRIDFMEKQNGYITNIKDSGGVDALMVNRPKYTADNGSDEVDNIPDYSHLHHYVKNEDAETQITRVGTRDTLLHLEAGLDAMTKVIAEGGRFKCVEKLGMAIKDTSLFFAQKNPGYRTVNFQSLWCMWDRPFGAVYGVEDDTIKNHITAAKKPENVKNTNVKPDADHHNYNLDTHQVI